MSAAQHDHPERSELEAFGVGQLDPARSSVVEKHVAGCESCCDAVQKAPDDTLVRQLREAATLPPGPKAAAVPTRTETLTQLPAGTAADGGGDAPADLAQHSRYRLLKLLGRGGMGAVYQAEHGVMRRLVALKVINREYTSNPAAAVRFQREIRAAAQLHHPNIVVAYDAEQAGETHFLVMEYIDGVSLDRLVAEKGPLPVAEACDYVRQAALGLQHAHERGMVHRDVKPHNLIRSADGVVKVLDFGLASVVECGEGQLTGTNVIMGTPDYIAPEQAEDTHAADARSDIYALGCTLYHLLTGRPPFKHPSTLLKLVAHREETPPPVRAGRPDVSAELAAVLDRMMAKSPADRYQTASAVAAALQPFTDAGRAGAAAVTATLPKAGPAAPAPKRRRRWLVAGALAALCGVVFAAAAVVVHIQTDSGEVTIQTDDPNIEVVVTKGGKLVRIVDPQSKQTWQLDPEKFELSMAGQPDGLTIALDGRQPFTLKRKGEKLVTIARGPAITVDKPPPPDEGGEVRRIAWAGSRISDGQLSLSPDGRFVLAAAWGDNRMWDVWSGEVRCTYSGWLARFTPDGKQIVAGAPGSIRVYDAADGQLLHEFRTNKSGFISLRVSPAGDTVLTATEHEGWHLRRLSDGQLLHHWSCDPNHARPYFTPDGKYLLISFDDKPPLHVWDVAAGKEVDVLRSFTTNRYEIGAFTRDGRQAIDDEGHDGLQVIDVESGKVVRPLAWKPSPHLDCVYTGDARRVLESYDDGSVRLFDLESGKELGRYVMGSPVPHILAISTDQRYAAAASHDGVIVVWRLPDPPPLKPGDAP